MEQILAAPQIQEHCESFRSDSTGAGVGTRREVVAVPQIQEHGFEVFKETLQQRMSERIVELIVAMGQIIPTERWRVDQSR